MQRLVPANTMQPFPARHTHRKWFGEITETNKFHIAQRMQRNTKCSGEGMSLAPSQNVTSFLKIGKGKGKFQHITGHEVPETG